MEIYLVRHTEPAVDKGVCYGQADIDVTETFLKEAAIIKNHLPENIAAVYSSPLQRCTKLAAHLFPEHQLNLHADLMEINCGHWEMRRWDEIPMEETQPWMDDFVNVQIPGGESYVDLFERVSGKFEEIIFLSLSGHPKNLPSGEDKGGAFVLVAHGGVIRSILSHITGTALIDSFKIFTLHYGCVIKIIPDEKGFVHEILSNIPHEKETHKPSHY
jgi:alpha-ribazole phosphatase